MIIVRKKTLASLGSLCSALSRSALSCARERRVRPSCTARAYIRRTPPRAPRRGKRAGSARAAPRRAVSLLDIHNPCVEQLGVCAAIRIPVVLWSLLRQQRHPGVHARVAAAGLGRSAHTAAAVPDRFVLSPRAMRLHTTHYTPQPAVPAPAHACTSLSLLSLHSLERPWRRDPP